MNNRASGETPQPYLEKVVTEWVWNAAYPQDEKCACGHAYYRHFDTYDEMLPVGCKYCPCFRFEATE